MSNYTPKTKEISQTIVDQLQAVFNQRIPLFPKAFNRVLAKIMAGTFVILYKYAGFIFLQMFVRFATNEETVINGRTIRPLTEHGRLIGIGDPVKATRAEYNITLTSVAISGTIPSGSQIFNSVNGVMYLTIGDIVITAGTLVGVMRAYGDQNGGDGSGAIGNMEVGSSVAELVNPPVGVTAAVETTKELVTGADGETTEQYRQRIIDRYQKRPQGGAPADYEIWTEPVPGIINVYPYKGDPGQVDLYSEATPESSGSADGIPTAAQLLAVHDATQVNSAGLATKRPISAYVNSYAITRLAFEVVVTGLAAENLSAVQTKITEGLDQYFKTRGPFIAGLTIPPRQDWVSAAEIGGVVSNVASAYSATFTSALLKKDSVVIQLYSLGEGEKAKVATSFV